MIVVRSLRVTLVALATALAVCGPAAPADIDVVAETTLGSVPPQTHEEAVGASKSAMMGSPTTALANAEAAEKLAADIANALQAEGQRVGVVISGGNVDVAALGELLGS